MSFTVKNVITEALARANLVPRRQPAPGNMVEDALALLKGIASDYSRHNLLQFLRKEVELPEACEPDQYVIGNGYKLGENFFYVTDGHYASDLPEASAILYAKQAIGWDVKANTVYNIIRVENEERWEWKASTYESKEVVMAHLNGAVVKFVPTGLKPTNILGTVDPEIENDYVDAVIPKIADITEIYWRKSLNPINNTDQPLQFVSFEDFNNADYGIYVYTWQHVSDTKVELKLKPQLLRMLTGDAKTLVMIYNLSYEIELNGVLRIPDIYKELFVSALTYKLAVQFPRLTPEHTERLRLTMEDIEKSLKTVTRANKLVIREPGQVGGLYNMSQLDSGSFVLGP